MPVSTGKKPRHGESRSEYSLCGLRLVPVVAGRDSRTGRLGTARGIIASGRITPVVAALGQIALGVLPPGRPSPRLPFPVAQVSVTGGQGFGQVAAGAPGRWIPLPGPVLMLYCRLGETGIPATEAHAVASRRDDRQCQRTPRALFPWFPGEDDPCGE